MKLDQALRLTVKATEIAAARGVSIAIAVVDAGGHLITLHRMDGVPFIAAEVAWGKAWTAAAWGETSSDQADEEILRQALADTGLGDEPAAKP